MSFAVFCVVRLFSRPYYGRPYYGRAYATVYASYLAVVCLYVTLLLLNGAYYMSKSC